MTEYLNQGSKDTRSGFGEALLELGKQNPNVVALCADLTGSLKMDAFAAGFPDRFIQVGIAEAAFKRLEQDQDLITAVDHWLRTGKPKTIKESPRLDEALKEYTAWLAATTELRSLAKKRLRSRLAHCVSNSANSRVTDVLPLHIEKYLARQDVTANTKDGYCRAISSFFSWCMQGKRHWCVNNSCAGIFARVDRLCDYRVRTVDVAEAPTGWNQAAATRPFDRIPALGDCGANRLL